jgi:hypothetical protein
MVLIQFDRYLVLRQQEEPGPNGGTTPDVPSGVRIAPSLFGDDQLTKARKMQSACDAQRELDPRAELRLYLDEPLYKGDLSPMGWWKVSSHLHLPGVIET